MNKGTKEYRELRDKFAMAALSGLLACPRDQGIDGLKAGERGLTTTAYYLADKMMEAREVI